MKQYKVVSCDLDGTLLNDDFCVSYENKLSIEALFNKGVYVIPVTGRSLSEMPEVAEISHIRYIIFSNGAVIFDKKTQEYTYMCISKETSNFVLNTIKEYDCFVIIHHGGKTYANNMSDDEIKSYNVSSAVQMLVKQYANKETDFEKKAYLMDKVESFVVFFKDDKEMEKCKNILSSHKDLYVVDGWNHSIEIFSMDAGKDKALKILLQKLLVNSEDVISIGDSGNDIEMTKFAGLGLSVSNGSEELKNISDDIICSNNEHVLKHILSEYF